jgi:hypothetical protein
MYIIKCERDRYEKSTIKYPLTGEGGKVMTFETRAQAQEVIDNLGIRWLSHGEYAASEEAVWVSNNPNDWPVWAKRG